jgi:hypothetical protein
LVGEYDSDWLVSAETTTVAGEENFRISDAEIQVYVFTYHILTLLKSVLNFSANVSRIQSWVIVPFCTWLSWLHLYPRDRSLFYLEQSAMRIRALF